MRVVTWIYALVVVALLAWLGRLVLDGSQTDPRALLEAGKRRSSGPEVDTRRALADLEDALAGAEAQNDEALIEAALLARARLLQRTGGLTQARADLERVLTYYRPRSPAIESMLAEVVLSMGDVEDALARCDAVLARDPSQAQAWGVRARALIALANERIDAARRTAGTALADQGYARGLELMQRMATLDREDQRRARYEQQLVDALPTAQKSLAAEILERLDEASALLTEVPEALAHSFEGVVERDALRAYLELLRDSGRVDAAIDFGLAVRDHPAVREWPPFLRELIHALLDARRPDLAADLIRPELGKTAAPDADFYASWAQALYRSGRWRSLAQVANLVRAAGDDEARAAGTFYMGIAQTRLKQYPEAALTLNRFIKHPDAEPVPGALPLVWQAIAEGHRARGHAAEEKITLQHRLKLAPDRYEGAGEAWLRMADLWLESRPPNRSQGFESLTQAMRLAPAKCAEIEPRWRQLGEQLLAGAHIDVAAEREQLDRDNAALPEGVSNSFQLLRHAELLQERGNYAGAMLAARRLLELYPDFLPAIDIGIDAASRGDDAEAAARWLSRRVELGGVDATTLARMSALPRERHEPQWVLDLVRLDPEHTGRYLAAELLQEQGRTAEALSSLELIPPDALGDDGCMIAATLASDLRRYDVAQAKLGQLSASPEVLTEALPLALDLGVRERDERHLSRLMRLLELRVDPDIERLLACADHMLIEGLPSSALELCTLLDSRQRWRGAGVFVRLAQASWVLGDREAAAEHIERAAAYDDTGLAEIGRLLGAVDERAWSALPERVADLRATAFVGTPLQEAALDALGERTLDARERIKVGLEEEPDEALWTLLAAAVAALSGEGAPSAELGGDTLDVFVFGTTPQGAPLHDPRPLLARLIALGHPDWAAWTIADLERSLIQRSPSAAGALWPSYLAGLGQEWLGRPEQAERHAHALVAAWPKFAPAWDLLQSALEDQLRRPDHPKLLRLAQQRQARLGVSPGDRVEELVLQARILEGQGQSAAALRALQGALAIDPERGAALRTLGQILRARGEWGAAIEAFHAALDQAEPTSDSHPVAEFLELLREARAADALLDDAVGREIDFLARRFEEDPLVALAQAERAIPPERAADRSAQRLAVDRLDEFRRRTAGRAVDELRPGASRAWCLLLSRVDRAAALAFVQAELLLQPGSIDLWRLLGAAAADADELELAFEALDVAQRMLPDGATARRAAELAAERGDDIEAVRKAVAEAARLERVKSDDARLQWTLARALVRGESGQLNEGLAILARLWDARDAVNQPEEVGRVGDTYGVALCRRNQPADRALAARVLTEAAEHVADPSRRNLVRALASIAQTEAGAKRP